MRCHTLTFIVMAAALTAGCSSKPRAFAPQLTAAPADELAYQQSLARCQESAGQAGGKPVGSKIASGAGTAAIGGATASGATWGGAAAVGAASIVALPVVGLVWGLSRGERSKKERRIQTATAQCLQEDGYSVAGWTKVKKVKPTQAKLAVSGQPELTEAPTQQVETAALVAPE